MMPDSGVLRASLLDHRGLDLEAAALPTMIFSAPQLAIFTACATVRIPPPTRTRSFLFFAAAHSLRTSLALLPFLIAASRSIT